MRPGHFQPIEPAMVPRHERRGARDLPRSRSLRITLAALARALLAAAALIVALMALPAEAAQIKKITWDVTGGSYTSLTGAGPITGGSVTWTPSTPLVTPCTHCGGPATWVLILTGPTLSFQRSFGFTGSTISSAYFHLYSYSITPFCCSYRRFGITFPNPTSTAISLGRGFLSYSSFGPNYIYGFTLGNEVRTPTACGDGRVDVGEGCDDGNTVDGDGCSAECTICDVAPLTGCLVATEASLTVVEKKPGNEKLKARLKGFDGATAQSDFGNPVSDETRYGLCLYDAGGELVEELAVERAGDLCGNQQKDCWKAKGEKGWSYKDPLAASDGVKKIAAVSGAGGKGKIEVQAANKEKKGQTAMPVRIAEALQHEVSAKLQVRVHDGICVEATVTNVKKADGVQFKAKTP